MTKPLSICMFGSSFLPRRGGMEYVIHHLSEALVDLGHNVTVIAERTAWSGIGVDHQYSLARYGVPTRGLRSLGISEIDSLFTIWRMHRSKHFDVLHSHGVSYAGTRAIRSKKLFGIPVVMTPHGEDIQRVPEIGYGLRLDEKWNSKICDNLNQSDAVTAISLSVQSELDCVDDSKVIRIPNGIHVDKFGPGTSDFLQKRLNLSSDTIIVLSVGRNHVKKGYDYGIKTVALLKQQLGINNIHYVVVGKLSTEHSELVAELGMQDNVSLIEELKPEEVTECYYSADIFFSPSIIEGLSLVSIEAIACGLPLVVTDVPGNEDIVRDTGAGIIVKTKDPLNMAEGLRELIEHSELRKKYSSIALQQVVQYDWREVAKRYANVYKNVLNNVPVGLGS